jgi:hypothetical protein
MAPHERGRSPRPERRAGLGRTDRDLQQRRSAMGKPARPAPACLQREVDAKRDKNIEPRSRRREFALVGRRGPRPASGDLRAQSVCLRGRCAKETSPSRRRVVQERKAGCATSHPAFPLSPLSRLSPWWLPGGSRPRAQPMPGEHSSYWVGLTPLPRFRAAQDGRLPRTYLQVRGTTTIHAAATSSGLPRTPLRAPRVGVQGPPLRGERGTSKRRPRCGCFL